MVRLPLLLALTLAAVGCGKRSQPVVAPTVPAPALTPLESPSPQTPALPTAPAAPTTQTQPAVAAAPSSPLRELAGKLSESDGSGGWRTNEKAATELEKLGAEGIAGLWPLLSDPSADVRRGAAIKLLGEFNPTRREQVAAMSALLDDADRTVRGIGLAAVRQMQSADQIVAVPRLARLLDPAQEEKVANRAAVARLIGTLRGAGTPGFPALVSAASSDPDAPVRAASWMAIAQIASPEEAARQLAKGLADKDPSPRLVAAARLRQLGPAAAPAAKELAAVLGDSEARVADAAAEALINIGKPAAEALAGQLTSSNANVRRLALACLAKIGPPAESAKSAIEKCLQDTDPQVKQLAEAALRRISGK